MARYIAKNIVASGLAKRCEVQLAYAIGVAEPTSQCASIRSAPVQSPTTALPNWCARISFSLRAASSSSWKLRRPIYRSTAAFGHFGRSEDTFSWEAKDRAEALKERAAVAAKA